MKEEQCQVLCRPHDRVASQSGKQGYCLLRLVWQEGGHARRGAGMADAPVAVPDLALLLPREAVSCLTPKPARVASAGCLHLPPYSPEAFPLRPRPLLIVSTHTQINEY